jgi:hypothetical protein
LQVGRVLLLHRNRAQFLHKLLCLEFYSCCFCLERLGCTLQKLLKNNIIENLIYIPFVQIHHVLKIENQHIHNLQKLKVQLADIFPCKNRILFYFIDIHRIDLRVVKSPTLVWILHWQCCDHLVVLSNTAKVSC